MDSKLKEILDNSLGEETQAAVQEAIKAKITEAQEQARKSLNEEYAARYESDKQQLVSAMDRMIKESIAEQQEKLAKATQEMNEEKARLSTAIRESRKAERTQVVEMLSKLESFVTGRLNEELEELQIDKTAIREQRIALAGEKAKLREAFRAKVLENSRKLVEAKAAAKAEIVEAQKVLEDKVSRQLVEELTELATDHKALKEARVEANAAIREAKELYNTKLKENTRKITRVVQEAYTREARALREGLQSVKESKVHVRAKLKEHQDSLNNAQALRIKKLERVMFEQLNKELTEFSQDHKALVEKRVTLVKEAKVKLDEQRRAFVARASKLVEATMSKHLKSEMVQLKESIMEARANMFGRKLFEAYQAEFLVSNLSEGLESRKLKDQLVESQKKLAEAQTALRGQQKLLVESTKRVQVSEERAQRVKTLSELLAPLSNEKKVIMEDLLSTVKTDALKSAFQRYLPSVLNETRGKAPQRLVEHKTVVTGDRGAARPTNQPEVTNSAEIIELRRLAGIKE